MVSLPQTTRHAEAMGIPSNPGVLIISFYLRPLFVECLFQLHRPHQDFATASYYHYNHYLSRFQLQSSSEQARRKRSGRLSTSPTKNSGPTGSGGPRPYQKLAQALPKIQPRRKRSGRLGSARPNEKCFRRACRIIITS